MGKAETEEMNSQAMPMAVHCYIRESAARCETLRTRLAALLEQEAMLKEHAVPRLEAEYLRCLGQLELALFQAEVTNAGLRRRIELLRALLNRGEALTPVRRLEVDTQLCREQLEWEERLRADERKIQEALQRLGAPTLSPEAAKEMKSIYRRLVRRLHPDVTGGESDLYRRYWNEVQDAYRNGDLDYLVILAEMIEHAEQDATRSTDISPLDTAAGEIRRLEELLQVQVDRLAALRRQPPLCHEMQLRDPTWIAGKRQELEAAIRREETLHRILLDELQLIESECSSSSNGGRASPRAVVH